MVKPAGLETLDMRNSPMLTTAQGMLRANTPIQDYTKEFGLYVKREDLACPPPGPPFSKTRGVYAHVKARPEKLIGVLDTAHSQAGHAVARACQILGKKCVNFYPVYKHEFFNQPGPHKLSIDHAIRPPQLASQALGAELHALPAGRSCILYHAARKFTHERGGYLMPNALKLEESITETAKEVPNDSYDTVLIPASSGTIAAGVIRGFAERIELAQDLPQFIIHLGYKRSHEEVMRYLLEKSGISGEDEKIMIVDEGYAYKDKAMSGTTPPWPCNEYYDLKAFRWYFDLNLAERVDLFPGKTLFWNIG